LPLCLYYGYTLALFIMLFAVGRVLPLAKRLGTRGVEQSIYIVTALVPFLCAKG
jgi:hypothetical protein